MFAHWFTKNSVPLVFLIPWSDPKYHYFAFAFEDWKNVQYRSPSEHHNYTILQKMFVVTETDKRNNEHKHKRQEREKAV